MGLRLAGAVGVRRRGHRAARRTQADLFAVTTPVAAGRRAARRPRVPGQRRSPGLGHVGIALDPQTMLAADARAGAVVVRTLPADQVLGIGRPSLGQRAPVAGARADRRAPCGWSAATPSTRRATTAPAQWGGYPNGLIPPSAMCPLGRGRPLAALRRRGGLPRDVGGVRRRRSARRSASPTPTAPTPARCGSTARSRPWPPCPGTSNHGWGLAVDLCGGIENFGTAAVRLDEGQRRPVRLPAPRLGRARATGARSRGTGSTRAPESGSRTGIVGGRSYRADDSRRREPHADRLRHLHRPRHRLRRLRRHRPAGRPAGLAERRPGGGPDDRPRAHRRPRG